MAQKKQEMSLEEFEAKRRVGRVPGTGSVQQWLRALEPLTPTRYPLDGKSARVSAGGISGTWAGRGTHRTTSIRDEKGGGKLKTTIIDDELWIVWYPEAKNGA